MRHQNQNEYLPYLIYLSMEGVSQEGGDRMADNLLGGDLLGGAKKRLSRNKHCATGNKMTHGSCLNKDLIRKVARIMNSLGKTKKTYETIDLSKPCYEIHAHICKNLEEVDDCKSEACLLFKDNILKKLSKSDRRAFEESFQPPQDEDMVKGKIKKKKVKKKGKTVYKPYAKDDDEAWLSTMNIEEACKRDMNAHPEYMFMGAEPIDFSDCKVSPLCRFNHEELRKKGKTKVGFVFNTDPHDEDGEHWISMYLDLVGHNLDRCPAIYYFDSYGREPPEEIEALIQECRERSQESGGEPMRYFYNDENFQKRGAQCGMYAIHFLRQMSQGTSFRDYLNQRPSNEMMRELRKVYFVSPNDV